MIENGLFVLGGPETQLHDILWAVHHGKNDGRSEGEENIGEFQVTVVGDRSRILKFSMHHQDPSMESTSNEREGVHLHTLVDHERKRSSERG